MSTETDKALAYVENLIGHHENFPIPGVLFHDSMIRFMSHITKTHENVGVIVGIDARGFLFGPILAQRLGCAFVPVRKAGKLPGQVLSMSSTKEYGADVLQIQEGAIKQGAVCIVVDDLLATGGTLKTTCALVQQAGGVVAECCLIVSLPELKGSDNVPHPCFAIFQLQAGC